MTLKAPWEVGLQGGEICSEEGCERSAIRGGERHDGAVYYLCEPHDELGRLNGQLDWLAGEADTLESWLRQAEAQAARARDCRHPDYAFYSNDYKKRRMLVLKSAPAEPEPDDPHLDHWVITLSSLLAAVEVAERLTEAELSRRMAGLEK